MAIALLEFAVDRLPPVARWLRLGVALRPLYWLYARLLWRAADTAEVPRHLALILDGNRRYAGRSQLDVRQGYAEGARRVADVLRWSDHAGVAVVTLWALSVDNLRRSPTEISAISEVVEGTIAELVPLAKARRWQLRGIGRLELVPPSLRAKLEEASAATTANARLLVQFAVGYGGREEIIDALHRWSEQPGVAGKSVHEAVRALTVDELRNHLYSPDVADPDLILRTSGEIRLSGFLLWQSVHSEFYFSDVLWPEFREIDFLRAIRAYQRRSRRFGR